MFRELVRKKQALSEEECLKVLKKETRGVLSVNGDDGYPYGIPLNHYYCEEDGKLYFHGGKTGHRVDAVKQNDKVSYCVFEPGARKDGEWWLTVRSVVIFGRMELIEDRETTYEISRKLSYKFTEDESYIADEIKKSGPGTLLMALVPEHMTGKLVTEK